MRRYRIAEGNGGVQRQFFAEALLDSVGPLGLAHGLRHGVLPR
jgi:hypothetical protein